MAGVSSHMSQLVTKFRGCLVGALLGDCLGAPFEGDFPVSKSVLVNYFNELLSDEPKSGVQQIRPYTDDTAMTRSVATSLIEKKQLDCVDMAKRFAVEFYKEPRRGYGMNVVNVFSRLKGENYADAFRPAREQFDGRGSYGNGSAMRIAPVALFCYKNEDKLINTAKDSSLITHAHEDGYNGAILQCLAVHEALMRDPTDTIDPVKFVDDLINKMDGIELKAETEGRTYVDKLKAVKWHLENQTSLTPEEVAALLGNDVSAPKSVPTAIYSFLHSSQPIGDFETNNPFIRTLYYAISLGGDTDTIGSMACSIAGAYYGIDLIPKSLQSKCEGLDFSLNLADKLVEMIKT